MSSSNQIKEASTTAGKELRKFLANGNFNFKKQASQSEILLTGCKRSSKQVLTLCHYQKSISDGGCQPEFYGFMINGIQEKLFWSIPGNCVRKWCSYILIVLGIDTLKIHQHFNFTIALPNKNNNNKKTMEKFRYITKC